jgi:hypothetical protein
MYYAKFIIYVKYYPCKLLQNSMEGSRTLFVLLLESWRTCGLVSSPPYFEANATNYMDNASKIYFILGLRRVNGHPEMGRGGIFWTG